MEKNQQYLSHLKIEEVPWHRLTTPYGRATDFPRYFATLWKMDDRKAVKEALYEIVSNTEHQGTLWHSSPFAMIFLTRVLEHALAEYENNKTAYLIVDKLLDFFIVIAECFHDGDEMEHADPLPLFSDLLKEEYLWSEEYDEEEDEIRYEEEEVFPDDLFYSFYYYSYQVLLSCKPMLKRFEKTDFGEKVLKLQKLL